MDKQTKASIDLLNLIQLQHMQAAIAHEQAIARLERQKRLERAMAATNNFRNSLEKRN
jgi:hypothetical protein